MNSRQILIGALAAVMCVGSLTACGGGGARTTIQEKSVSTGQELMDLKRAFESGAMTEKEYEKARKAIINR
jgi:hypothetical protein